MPFAQSAIWDRFSERGFTEPLVHVADHHRIASLERRIADLESRLHESEEHFRRVCELTEQILWSAGPDGDVLSFSPLWSGRTGLTLAQSLGTGWAEALHPDDIAPTLAEWARGRATATPCRIEYRLRMGDGSYRWFHCRAAPQVAPDGSVQRWYGTIEDIHDARLAQEALEASEAFASNMIESSTDLVVVLDREWRIAYLNTHAAEFLERTGGGGVGDPFWDTLKDQRHGEDERRCREAVASGLPVRFETFVASQDRWLDISACPFSGGLVIFLRDITDLKRTGEALVRLAQQDVLTGLANRTLFNEALEDAFLHRESRETSVLLIDLDLFKEVNDTLGHPVGDKLLKIVAQRFHSALGEGDVMARLGGDEFAVIHRPQPDGGSAEALAQRLMEGFTDCFFVDGIAIRLAASIGIAFSSPWHTSANDLFKAADIALYRAKEEGRGAIRAFDTPMAKRLQDRQSMKTDLEVALVLDELRLVYQPLVDIASGRVSGAEALLRWRHPAKGEVSPAEFIPLAEDTGLIVEIGDWVLVQACHQAASWPDDRTVAVNLSPVQLRDETLPERVLSALAQAGLAPHRLELEITESVLLNDSDRNVALLHTLREAGVRIALDDFGTGYSSLSYLRHFPFDKLKLDRCFVGDIGCSPQSEAIARAAGEMGRALAMTTTAEGVETKEQLEWLRANGWTQAQGWHTGRPMEAAAIGELFARDAAPSQLDTGLETA